jgi:hypothetical protein
MIVRGRGEGKDQIPRMIKIFISREDRVRKLILLHFKKCSDSGDLLEVALLLPPIPRLLLIAA